MNIIGADPTNTFTLAEMQQGGKGFSLGDRFTANDGKEYVFVVAGTGGVTGEGYVCIIDEAYSAVMADTTTSASARGDLVGVGVVAIAASSYGWLQVKGPCNLRVNVASANVQLNTTGTAGQLDDDATGGSEVVERCFLTTARAATAGLSAGILNYPSIGATL